MADKKAYVITMEQAVKALGLRVAGEGSEMIPTDVSSINILCPGCAKNHSSRRFTMNIDYEKNLFGCP